MTEVFTKYRVVLIILAVLMLAVLIWLFFLRQDFGRIPLRGVFVTLV